MIKCCIGVVVVIVVVLSDVFVLFVKDIDLEDEDGNIVKLASAVKGIQAQRITKKKTKGMSRSFLLISW
jgi:hypothetical protein